MGPRSAASPSCMYGREAVPFPGRPKGTRDGNHTAQCGRLHAARAVHRARHPRRGDGDDVSDDLRMTTHERVNQAAMVVAQDLSLASSAAARERKPIRIARGADRASITIAERAGGKVLSTRWLGKSDAYALDSIAFSVSPVDLFPSGMTSSALSVTLWAGGYSRQVTMSRASWVRVP